MYRSSIGWADDKRVRVDKIRTFENADGSTEVVDPSGGLEGGSNHRGSRDKIVSEGVVEVALRFVDKPKSHTTFSGASRRTASSTPWGRLT